MAKLKITTGLLVISLVVLSLKDSSGKSMTMNLTLTPKLSPEWKAEITQRASDYGNLSLFLPGIKRIGCKQQSLVYRQSPES